MENTFKNNHLTNRLISSVLLGILAVVFFLSLFTFITAQLYTYFNTGAKIQDILHLSYTDQAEHTPYFDTLYIENVIGRDIEPYNEDKIKADYSNAWYLMNKSQNEVVPAQAEHYFFEKPFDRLKQIAKTKSSEEVFIERTDLCHNLKFYLYSIDGQVISVIDSNVIIKERILTSDKKNILFNITYKASYEVTFVLNDGNWRVRHIVPFNIQVDTLTTKLTATHTNSYTEYVSCKEQEFSYQGQQFIPRGVNYYPADNSWLEMWENFDSQRIKEDMSLIQHLGANTVRIFIPFKTFGKGNIKIEELEKLDQFLYHAKENNLLVIITLFDFIHDYTLENWSKSDRQLEKILKRYKNHTEILAWDLKNEADLDYKDHGKAFVDDWLTFIIKQARIYDSNHLITIGWSSPEAALNFSENLDFIAFHYYQNTTELSSKIQKLRDSIPQKPIILEEFGQSTYNSIFYKNSMDKDDQYDYFLDIRTILKQHNDIGYIAWTLHDFKDIPNYVVGSGFFSRKIQQHFGLYDINGSPKPAAMLIAKDASLIKKNTLRFGKFINLFYIAVSLLLLLVVAFYHYLPYNTPSIRRFYNLSYIRQYIQVLWSFYFKKKKK
jgi:Cellulase (glycosyl hydrolase family 5)